LLAKIEMNLLERISVISAPSNLGLVPLPNGNLSGVTETPEALIDAGLLQKLDAEFQSKLPVPAYERKRDTETYILNPYPIRDFALSVAIEVAKAITNDRFPLVLGGDCSILLGNMLALKRLGRYGLFFLDGHSDFYQPSPDLLDSGVAGMDLAFATGRGPDVLSNISGEKPLVRDEDVIVFGFRDMEEAQRLKMPKLSETKMTTYDLNQVREMGIEESVSRGLAKLAENDLDGFWIHVDADVLDDEIMPAVDSRQPGGLTFEEFTHILQMLAGSNCAVGMHVGIFDPHMDPDKRIASRFASAIAEGLRPDLQ